ncbi:hypothetical protein [Gelidibacter maritimus]|uniref:cGAS/DncV-like nucleotidyltransferase C-terminal helical domain-containing protein n=1 Tax=Gelidibacter maritimus TaxID=2761487 RepID=A0A7W2M8K7_9FLAO|nr:hypothetical protein [Gelidibacter maritimus]MBA6154668.1 hypothetical protein [Gelidibacter maritimus]
MERDYDELVKRVKARYNPAEIDESTLLNESLRMELKALSGSKVLEYVKRSMQGVEPAYTQNTMVAGDKVKAQLKKNNPNLDYEYQGSVMCNTHIKGYSDIDLVQLCNRFYFHDSKSIFTEEYKRISLTDSQRRSLLEVIEGSTYNGDANHDLREIRLEAEKVLSAVYNNVDSSKDKSIEVNLTSPKRKVDVVTASWYKSVNSVKSGNEAEKGIKIYDKRLNDTLPVDYPFLKIKMLNEKDKTVNGRLKKMIRFLKTIKADSDININISSFDISSVCYNINSLSYYDKPYYELVYVLKVELEKIVADDFYRNSIKSIDGTECVFRDKPEKYGQLVLLLNELNSIKKDLVDNNKITRFL